MDLLDDDMGKWLLILYDTLSGLLRTDIEISLIACNSGLGAQALLCSAPILFFHSS